MVRRGNGDGPERGSFEARKELFSKVSGCKMMKMGWKAIDPLHFQQLACSLKGGYGKSRMGKPQIGQTSQGAQASKT